MNKRKFDSLQLDSKKVEVPENLRFSGSPFAFQKMVKKILFICKYNAFRSKIAESCFNKTNKNKKITAISRGFIMGAKPDSTQKKIAKKFNLEIKGTQKPVNIKELKQAYKIIITANDIPKIMFNYQLADFKNKLQKWRIKDEQNKNIKNIKKIIKKIIKKTKKLVKEENATNKRI